MGAPTWGPHLPHPDDDRLDDGYRFRALSLMPSTAAIAPSGPHGPISTMAAMLATASERLYLPHGRPGRDRRRRGRLPPATPLLRRPHDHRRALRTWRRTSRPALATSRGRDRNAMTPITASSQLLPTGQPRLRHLRRCRLAVSEPTSYTVDQAKITPSTAAATTILALRSSIRRQLLRPAHPLPKPPLRQIHVDGNRPTAPAGSFLPRGLSDAGPQCARIGHDGPAFETLHHTSHCSPRSQLALSGGSLCSLLRLVRRSRRKHAQTHTKPAPPGSASAAAYAESGWPQRLGAARGTFGRMSSRRAVCRIEFTELGWCDFASEPFPIVPRQWQHAISTLVGQWISTYGPNLRRSPSATWSRNKRTLGERCRPSGCTM